ncbi:MAG: cytochrome c3 family protein [Deltaproteobacteria bacterium]|nr:cytochrome c3 family protein [Deltaproteobacteria bacterium]
MNGSIANTSVLPLVVASALSIACGDRLRPDPSQPVFSHRAHAALGIDCRYCHTAAEIAAQAGMPTTATCRGCHRSASGDHIAAPAPAALASVAIPETWRRRCRLPPDVGFDHAAHLTAGIDCATCHSQIDRVSEERPPPPPTMVWCLGCHRDPAAAAAAAAPGHCSGCHR